MYLRPLYDKDNSAMGQFKEKSSISEIKKIMRNVHTSWCSHLIKDKDKSYDITQIYDVLNNIKVLVEKRHEKTTSPVNTFHGRFSVLSAL